MAMLNNQRVYIYIYFLILRYFGGPTIFAAHEFSTWQLFHDLDGNATESKAKLVVSRHVTQQKISKYTKLSITSFPLFWLFPQYLG